MKEKFLGLLASYIIKHYFLIFVRFKISFKQDEDKVRFYQAFDKKKAGDKKIVIAFYHQDELCLIPYFLGKNITVMVSSSKDGEIMNTALTSLGFEAVRGSSNKKPVAALIAAIKKTKLGYNFAIAVDGPRGPIYEVKEGAIKISEKANTPIVPLRVSPDSYYLFKKAWNQARLPLPFSKVTVHVGKIDFYDKESLKKELDSL